MLAVLSLVHQTSRVTSSDCSYDVAHLCASALRFLPLFLPTATSHASSRANPMIRPKIATEECKASPGAKSLLGSCDHDLLVSYRPLALDLALD